MARAPKDRPPVILHCDDDLVVIDKPSGVPSVPGRGGVASALELLRQTSKFAADEPFRVVHRLDKGASGVLLYARTLPAQRRLVSQFMERRVEKVYYAMVSGYVAADGEVDLSLYFNSRRGRVEASARHGKRSLTRYRILERVPGNTWLECEPVTGRMHQIRVHLAAIGHPLSVDPEYGGGQPIMLSRYKPSYRVNRRGEERPLVARLTLHAAQLTFDQPTTGERLTFEAPLPKDLRATLAQLGRLA